MTDLENNVWNLEHNAEQVDILISKNQAQQILYLKYWYIIMKPHKLHV